jgi:spore maturation protein CgeB
MNILVIGRYDQESFATHISQTLNVMGHKVFDYEIGIRYKRSKYRLIRNYERVKGLLYNLTKDFEKGRRNEVKRITNSCQAKIDLIISTSDFLYPEQVSHLKKHFNCKIVMWYPDAIINLKKSLFITSDYDCIFFKEPYFINILRDEYNAKNIFYLPECFNPLVHKIPEFKLELYERYISDITTAGNLHPYRVKFFSELKGYNIKIWGNPAPSWIDSTEINEYTQNQYIVNEEKSAVFHYSKIVLNNLHPGEVWGINVRAFEIAGCGGFQLINWRPGLQQLFNENVEIISFKNFTELKEMIEYYLKNDDERKRISGNAYKRAIKEHTYEKRLNTLLNTLNNNESGFPLPDIRYQNMADIKQ